MGLETIGRNNMIAKNVAVFLVFVDVSERPNSLHLLLFSYYYLHWLLQPGKESPEFSIVCFLPRHKEETLGGRLSIAKQEVKGHLN